MPGALFVQVNPLFRLISQFKTILLKQLSEFIDLNCQISRKSGLISDKEPPSTANIDGYCLGRLHVGREAIWFHNFFTFRNSRVATKAVKRRK